MKIKKVFKIVSLLLCAIIFLSAPAQVFAASRVNFTDETYTYEIEGVEKNFYYRKYTNGITYVKTEESTYTYDPSRNIVISTDLDTGETREIVLSSGSGVATSDYMDSVATATGCTYTVFNGIKTKWNISIPGKFKSGYESWGNSHYLQGFKECIDAVRDLELTIAALAGPNVLFFIIAVLVEGGLTELGVEGAEKIATAAMLLFTGWVMQTVVDFTVAIDSYSGLIKYYYNRIFFC